MKKLFLRGVGLALVLAAIPKLRHPDVFLTALTAYQLFPERLLPAVNYYVPALELVVGLFLLFGKESSRAAAAWGAALFLGFFGALSWARVHHLTLTCGCFGRIDSRLHRLPGGLELHIAGVLVTALLLSYIAIRRTNDVEVTTG